MKNLCLLLACLSFAACSPPGEAEKLRAPISHPGDDLRAELGLTLPASDMMIIASGEAVHHTRAEWSVVAWRSADGAWTVERAGRESGHMFPMETKIFPLKRKLLSAEEARRLEQLIAAPALYREAVPLSIPPIGGFESAMEIVTPKTSRLVKWGGRLTGRLGQVADIVIGR